MIGLRKILNEIKSLIVVIIGQGKGCKILNLCRCTLKWQVNA